MKVRYPKRAAKRYMMYMTPMEMLEMCCIFFFVGLKSENISMGQKIVIDKRTIKSKKAIHKVYTVKTHFSLI